MGIQGTAPGIVAETSLWVLVKEWFLNKRQVELIHVVGFVREETLNDAVKLFDWARENLSGRWNIRIYNRPTITNKNMFGRMTILAKFNREEDAMAFKLRWS